LSGVAKFKIFISPAIFGFGSLAFEDYVFSSAFGIYQGFTAFAEGYPYKILDLLTGTLLI
jgi:hypothetical protein